MRAINLYFLTRLSEIVLYPLYEKNLSQREHKLKIHSEEIDQIKVLINNLRLKDKSPKILDNWFYSFTIPQIGKEFDLLKIDKNGIIVNLELKSQSVPETRIEHQLKQNRYYLSHIGKTIYSFTYVRENDSSAQLYMYDNILKKCSFDELLKRILEIKTPIIENIESLFRPKDYLISPINTPQKFFANQYYLSKQQESIKKEILAESKGLWGIKGSAGTGKTLLLYDIAKELSSSVKVCIVHCGILSEGHKLINLHSPNLSVIAAKEVSKETIENYSVVCVDETQRLYTSNLDIILDSFEENIIDTCIFSYDFAQALSKSEQNRNNPQRLNKIQGFRERELTNRIRTNKEIFSFIRTMMRLNDRPKNYVSYDNIDVLYADNIHEADYICKDYIDRGYTFITFTPSQYVYNLIDHYSEYINSHQVIGQEFDKVIVILDYNFRYSPDGVLQAKDHPNPDYLFPRLFYQNISRAREKLCIIVLDNIALFKRLLCVKEHVMDESLNDM